MKITAKENETTTTTITAGMTLALDKANYDASCKRLLAEKVILAWIMKNTMKEFASFAVPDIADHYIAGQPQVSEVPAIPDETNAPRIMDTGVEDVTVTEGTVTFDIRFQAILPGSGRQAGLLINIEAQNDFYPGYPLTKRAVYYCSRMISSQYGTVFTNSHYEKIQKVYSLWICVNPPKSRENTITGYHISEAGIVGNVQEKSENYDLASIVMICLGDQGSAERSSLLQLLDVLLSSDLDSAVKKKILSDDFGIPMTQPFARRIDEMCNLSEGVLQKGIEQGMKQGMEQGLQLSLKNLMATLHLTTEQAMDALKIAAADREKYVSLISSDR